MIKIDTKKTKAIYFQSHLEELFFNFNISQKISLTATSKAALIFASASLDKKKVLIVLTSVSFFYT